MYPTQYRALRLTLPLALVLVALSAFLIAFRVEQVLLDFAQARSLRAAHQLRDQVETGFRLGLSLADQATLAPTLQRQRAQDPALAGVRVLGEQQNEVARAGPAEAFDLLNPVWTRQLLAQGAYAQAPAASVARQVGRHSATGLPAIDASGRRAAVVWLVHDRSALRQAAWSVLAGLLPWALGITLVLALALATLARPWLPGGADGQHTPSRRDWALLLAAAVCTFAALSLLAWKARELARPMLMEQVDESARTVLQQAQGHLERAVRLGIPATRLVGVDEMLQAELKPAPELAFVAWQPAGADAVLTPRRDVDPALAQAAADWLAGRADGAAFRIARQPLVVDGVTLGELATGTPVNHVDQRLRSILMDLLLAAVVSLVLAREALGGLWQRLQQARNRLPEATGRAFARLRLIVFLTALSDELLRPFFAVFAAEARPPELALSPTMLAGLPVLAFMATLTLAQPLGPWITRRVDARRALLATAVLGALLLAATALARDTLALVLLRAGTGASYGLLLILAQTTVLRITDSASRAQGLVGLSAAIVAAGVCGPALGGLLVERLGTLAAFLACAACLAASAVLAWRLAPLPQAARANLAGIGWRGVVAVLRHQRAMAVTWLAAVPARFAAAGLLVLVTPLYVQELGETAAVSGRIQLLYFLAFMLTAPWVARWSDQGGTRKPWILAGCALSALACAALPLLGGVAGMAACCALLGVAQALLSAPQLAFVTEAFEHDTSGASPEQALAAFRFIERVGSIAAPLGVALAVDRFGLVGAVGALGALLAAAGLLLALALSPSKLYPRHAAPA